jgi:diguanylate cyclase (GGDEF)-like protein/PAS domain S-box-containing protein
MPNPTESPVINEQGRSAIHLSDESTARNRNLRALRASELRYRRVFETAPFGILVVDAETGVVVDANRYVCALLGFTSSDIVGQPLWNAAGFRNAAASKHRFRELWYENEVRYDGLPLETKQGDIRRVEFISTLYLVDGHPFVQCHIRDVTQQIKAEQGASEEHSELVATIDALRTGDPATHDDLTGLATPGYFEESLTREIHRAQRGKYPLSVSLLDLDGFGRVNEQFGRPAGDAVLREVGRILREHLRKSDMACRYADDEFVLVFGSSAPAATRRRLEQIRAAVKGLELTHEGRQIDPITISAGVVTAAGDRNTTRDLLRSARLALAAAKRDGGDRIHVHE